MTKMGSWRCRLGGRRRPDRRPPRLWPDIEIDGITIGLVIMAILPWLGPIFTSVELPGGWKPEFQELRHEVRQELERGSERLDNRLAELQPRITGATGQQERLGELLARFDRYLSGLGLERPGTGRASPVRSLGVGLQGVGGYARYSAPTSLTRR